MFDADRPITNSTQDRLNRAVFSKYLARCLLDHKDAESLVVGLYGGWGVGKTSVINLVLDELNFAATNLEDPFKPIVLNFSPWSYSGQDQLIYSFFRRLSSVLRQVDYLENKQRIVHLLELYVSFFTHKPIPRALRSKRTLFEKLTFQGRDEIYAWESGRDLTVVKAELNELLRQQKHKIIIIIDNISRLRDEEIKQIFQIVKSIGDYANTAYLLSFDKDQVIEAIDRIDVSGGSELIDKIIQLPFNIPPISQNDLEAILTDRLKEVLNQVPMDTWNGAYWADIYYNALRFFFENCRDITRYVNTLYFSYSRLRDVVNPVDFFGLTAIEVFLPEIYAGVRDNKDLFTDLLDNVYVLDEKQRQKDKSRCDEIISRSSVVSHEIILTLLMHLFPRLRRIYQSDVKSYHSDALARKYKRVCSPDLFDVYFRLSIQAGQIPETEFQTILAMANNAELFNQALTRLNQDDRITKFLDQLNNKVIQKLSRDHIHSIVNALIDNGDLFPQGEANALSLDTPTRIHRIIHELLQRFHKTEDRFMLLQEAIKKSSKSLHIITHILKEQGKEHIEERDTFVPLEYRDLTPDQLRGLQQDAVKQIMSWAESDRLSEHPQLLPILYAWKEWDKEHSCDNYVREMTKSDKGLVLFLQAALFEPITLAMTQYEKFPNWEHYLKHIDTFIVPQKLGEHAKIIFEDGYFEKLREREQLAILIFLDLIKVDTTKFIPKTTV